MTNSNQLKRPNGTYYSAHRCSARYNDQERCQKTEGHDGMHEHHGKYRIIIQWCE